MHRDKLALAHEIRKKHVQLLERMTDGAAIEPGPLRVQIIVHGENIHVTVTNDKTPQCVSWFPYECIVINVPESGWAKTPMSPAIRAALKGSFRPALHRTEASA
jgi:hypothetical protein